MCDQLETIYRAIEYIESHLQTKVSVAQMAEEAGYSLFHFLRTFNRVVHHTPYDYLTRRRLSEAAYLLIANDRRIADISQDFCFQNQESFSRAFKRMFDVQPSQWRSRSVEITIRPMPPKTLEDLRYIQREEFHHSIIEELGETDVYGLMAVLDEENQVQQKKFLFDTFCETEFGTNLERYVSITFRIHRPGKTVTYFFMGGESTEPQPVFSALALYRIPAGRYAKILCSSEDKQLAMRYFYSTWLPGTGRKPARQVEIEFHSSEKGKRMNTEIYIPIDADSFRQIKQNDSNNIYGVRE